MSRRIINNNDSDSLKDEKGKTEVLQSQANSAEKRVHEAGDALTDIQADINKAEDVRLHLEGEIADKKIKHLEASNSLEERQSELRKVEGELSVAISGLEKIKADTQKAQSEHTHNLGVLRGDHDATRSKYQLQRTELMDEMAGYKKTIESDKLALAAIRDEIASAELQKKTYERDVLPLIPLGKKKLEEVEHELLVKKVAVKDEEIKLSVLVGKTNSEKVEYDQLVALRVGEEEIIAANMKTLIEKEGEVDKKIIAYRSLKEGVDQATERLNRREVDLNLQKHLLNSKQEVTNT